jgi:NAD(P)-dependent dehydrogenase (short-subunit alcohol dehydrogenase family)
VELAGRGAIITGASQGLGRTIAARFLEQGAGIVVVARTEEDLQRTREELAPLAVHRGQVVHGVPGDISRQDSCEAIVAAARAALPEVTILVNNAGVYGPIGRVEEVDWNAWMRAVEINLFGTVLMCRAVLPLMRARGYGKIVNISGGGAAAPLPRFSAYAAGKAAVVRLTETFAEELRESGVYVNAIAPGALNTRLLDEVLAAGPEKAGEDFYRKSVRQQQDGGTPLDKAAALAVFLASAASDGISGRLLSALWDDWARLPEWKDELAKTDVYTLRRIVTEDRGIAR